MGEKSKRKEIEVTKLWKKIRLDKYLILMFAVVVIVVLGYQILAFYEHYTPKDLAISILENLVGVLAAFLLFDIVSEKMTKDAYAEEMSERILTTLMANPEAMELFTQDQRKRFINATIQSIVQDKDVMEMIDSGIQNYMFHEADYRIRTKFDYQFELNERLPDVCDVFEHREEYYYVQEILDYQVKYLNTSANNLNTEEIKIGFVFDAKSLDNVLREKPVDKEFEKCIFRECLDIHPEDIQKLKDLYQKNSAEFLKTFSEIFKVHLKIDKCIGQLKEVRVQENGIIAIFHVDYDLQALSHSIRIIFHMPKKWETVIEITLVDPVRAPKITVSYPEDIMEVNMYSFLGQGEDSSFQVAHEQTNGIYDISISDEWIYPISGVVFTVKRKN